jgi:hypothetical protein
MTDLSLKAEEKQQILARARAVRAMKAVLMHPSWSWAERQPELWKANHGEDRRLLGQSLAVAVHGHADLVQAALAHYTALFPKSRRHIAPLEWGDVLREAVAGRALPDLAEELSNSIPIWIRDPTLALKGFPARVRSGLRAHLLECAAADSHNLRRSRSVRSRSPRRGGRGGSPQRRTRGRAPPRFVTVIW